MKTTTNIKCQKNFWTCPWTCKRYGQGQVTDTNNNDNNIYFTLFNKYKEQIEKEPHRVVQIISAMKNSADYELLTLEEQDKIFYDLMSIDKKIR